MRITRSAAAILVGILVTGGLALVPNAAEAAGTVTITSPSSGGAAVFDGDTITVDASSVPDAYCVSIHDVQTDEQYGYTCDGSVNGIFVVQVQYLTPGITEVKAEASSGSSDADSPPLTILADPGTYHPLTPQRVLDTRTDYSGGVAANKTTDFYASEAGVPSSADAVVFNLTETGASQPGYITAYTEGENRPTASNLNFAAGHTAANLVTVSSAYGDVTLYNGSSGAVQMIADVVGYYDSGTSSSPSSAGHFVSLSPSRFLDTRSGIGHAGTSPIPAQGTISVHIAGQGGVPASGATGVVFTLVASAPRAVGNFGVFPQSAGSTETSSLNFVAHKATGNLVALPLDASGNIEIHNASSGTTHAVADVVGFYTAAPSVPTAAGLFVPISPTRVLDTRYGTGNTSGKLESKTSLSAILSSLPARALLSGAALNATVADPQNVGYLTIWPSGTQRPVASELNFAPGSTTAEADIARVEGGNAVSVYNGSAGPLDTILDVDGLFTASSS